MLRDAALATLITKIFFMLLLQSFQSCLKPHDSCVAPLWGTAQIEPQMASLREACPYMRDRAARGLSISCSLGPSWEEQNMHKLEAGSDAVQQRLHVLLIGPLVLRCALGLAILWLVNGLGEDH